MDAELIRADSVKRKAEDIEKVNNLIQMGKEAMEEQVFYNPSNLTQNLI